MPSSSKTMSLYNAVASSSRTTVSSHAYLSHRFPPFFSAPSYQPQLNINGKGKGRGASNGKEPLEEEVSDAEWELRVGESIRLVQERTDNVRAEPCAISGRLCPNSSIHPRMSACIRLKYSLNTFR